MGIINVESACCAMEIDFHGRRIGRPMMWWQPACPQGGNTAIVECHHHPLEIITVILLKDDTRGSSINFDRFLTFHIPKDQINQIGQSVDGRVVFRTTACHRFADRFGDINFPHGHDDFHFGAACCATCLASR